MEDTFKDIPQKWLVTGGCGFIGTNLIDYLMKHTDVEVRIVDNLSVGSREDLRDVCDFEESRNSLDDITTRVQLWAEDVLDEKIAIHATEDIECIVHLAANTGVIPSIENPKMDCVTNVIGTVNYLEGARKNNVKKFILASSGAPLGEQEPPIHEEKVPKPLSPYGASKLAGEAYCHAYHGSFDLQTIALRFGNVYGPRSTHKGSVVAKFIKQALAGETLTIYGDGNQTRDFIYTEDLVRAILLASKVDIGGEVFQIATFQETTVNDIADTIKEFFENNFNKRVLIKYDNPRKGEVLRNYSDITKAKNILGWKPQFCLKEGIENTIKWFYEHKKDVNVKLLSES